MFVSAMLALAAVTGHKTPVQPTDRPILIAHRGASGSRPEHTLAAYRLAIEQGADFIEPDLVPTRDGRLVARHENEIGGTTDVAAHPEFAGRRTTKRIDGQAVTGWFTEDFTLAELRMLRARERLPELRPGSAAYDGQFGIPTFEEVIALAKRASIETGRTIGVYPETKHPTYFAGIGRPTDDLVLAALRAAGWDRADAPVFIQSFEVKNLKWLARRTRVRRIQLVAPTGAPADGAASSYAAMLTPDGLKAVATYAYGIGPDKSQLWQGERPSSLVRDAHAVGLRVHPWTYRAETRFLPQRYRRGDDPAAHGDVRREIGDALEQGIDGFFTDFPADGALARDKPF